MAGMGFRPRSAIAALTAAGRFLRANPDEIMRAAVGALGLRFGIPIAALTWLVDELVGEAGAVRDVVIETVPPGLRVGGSFVLMDTPVTASAVVLIDHIAVSGEEAAFHLRVEEVSVVPSGGRKTQLSALLSTGSLDLSRPGDLLANLPGIPPVVQAARGNRFIVDLMRLPAAASSKVRDALSLLTSVVTLGSIETDGRHIDIYLWPLPRGYEEAKRRVSQGLLRPSLDLARRWLPLPGAD